MEIKHIDTLKIYAAHKSTQDSNPGVCSLEACTIRLGQKVPGKDLDLWPGLNCCRELCGRQNLERVQINTMICRDSLAVRKLRGYTNSIGIFMERILNKGLLTR